MRRLVLIAAAVLTVSANFVWAPPRAGAAQRQTSGPPPLVRKNVLELSPSERRVFVRAVLELKRTPSPYDQALSYYDQFVEWHLSLYRCRGVDFAPTVGHGGSFFLPWHRVFVHLFERALSEVSGRRIAVPYWDWSSKASTDSVFEDDLMGGDGDPAAGYAVTSGPFQKAAWKVTLAPENQPWAAAYKPYLVRKFGAGQSPAPGGKVVYPLPPVTDVQWALSAPAYDVAPYDMSANPNQSFRNALEGWWRVAPDGTRYSDPVDHQHCGPDGTGVGTRDGGNLHNRVHLWAGGIVNDVPSATVFGTMFMPSSPADPVFFLHHANIDRLWTKWQAAHPGATFEPQALAHTPIDPFPAHSGVFTPTSSWHTSTLGYVYSDYVDSDDAPAPANLTTGASKSSPPLSFKCDVLAEAVPSPHR